ncbi:MAG: 50S ribosomal protein L32 [Bacteroidota bacterium]
MAHPKRKISKTRRDKRRTHHKCVEKTISICQTTQEAHLRHRAYVVDGNLMLHGNVVIENYRPVATA